jgi:hypothetical protein
MHQHPQKGYSKQTASTSQKIAPPSISLKTTFWTSISKTKQNKTEQLIPFVKFYKTQHDSIVLSETNVCMCCEPLTAGYQMC